MTDAQEPESPTGRGTELLLLHSQSPDLTHAELAAKTGLSKEAVKKRLRREREKAEKA